MTTMKFKTLESTSGRLSPQAPHVPAGVTQDGRVMTYEVTDVPAGVSMAEVMRLADGTVWLSRFSASFDEIGVGRILAQPKTGMSSKEFRQYLRGYLALTRTEARHGRATPEIKTDRAWASKLLNSHRERGWGLLFRPEEIAENWPTLKAAFERAGHTPWMVAAAHDAAEDGIDMTSVPE
jgi:hypothetical protein